MSGMTPTTARAAARLLSSLGHDEAAVVLWDEADSLEVVMRISSQVAEKAFMDYDLPPGSPVSLWGALAEAVVNCYVVGPKEATMGSTEMTQAERVIRDRVKRERAETRAVLGIDDHGQDVPR